MSIFNGDLSIFEVGNVIKIRLSIDRIIDAIITSINKVSDVQYDIYMMVDNEGMELASIEILLDDYNYGSMWLNYRSGIKSCELNDGIVKVLWRK